MCQKGHIRVFLGGCEDLDFVPTSTSIPVTIVLNEQMSPKYTTIRASALIFAVHNKL